MIKSIFYLTRNKNDAEDILIDAKVDGNRIYQPVAQARRVHIKIHRFKLQ